MLGMDMGEGEGEEERWKQEERSVQYYVRSMYVLYGGSGRDEGSESGNGQWMEDGARSSFSSGLLAWD